MRTSKLNKGYVDEKINILNKNAEKIKALEREIEEEENEEIESVFAGKTESQKANIFWKHALKVLLTN